MSSPDFWRDRRVLVTGHTGFIGAWVTFALTELGARVIGISSAPPDPRGAFAALGSSPTSLAIDVRHGAELRTAVTRLAPSVVFHLAAQPIVLEAYRDPVRTFDVNVLGTAALLEAVSATPAVDACVVVTSDKCYAIPECDAPRRELDPLGGGDPYSASKAAQELVVASYRARASGTSIVSARSGNVLGGGDFGAYRLVPALVTAFAQRRPARIRHPDSVRPWLHVVDVIRGYLALAEAATTRGHIPEAFNFGPPPTNELSVAELATRFAEAWGDGARWQLDDAPDTPEPAVVRLDSTRARQTLKWSPRVSLTDLITHTVAWYRAHQRGDDMAALTRGQMMP